MTVKINMGSVLLGAAARSILGLSCFRITKRALSHNALAFLCVLVCALHAHAGSIWAWGQDDYGQVSDTPTGTDFTAVAAAAPRGAPASGVELGSASLAAYVGRTARRAA